MINFDDLEVGFKTTPDGLRKIINELSKNKDSEIQHLADELLQVYYEVQKVRLSKDKVTQIAKSPHYKL